MYDLDEVVIHCRYASSQIVTMIEEPPKLVIKRSWNRPSPLQIAAFENIPTGFVVDAMNGQGTLAPNIKPILPDAFNTSIWGPALTIDTGPGDIMALLAALDSIQEGDILVSSFAGFQGCAAIGDRVAGMVKNNHAKAFITDGPVRDYVGMVGVGLPTWATGINANSPVSQGPGTVGLNIHIGGRAVSSGDMVIADLDGVVTVPFNEIDTVIKRLEHIKKLEKEFDQEVHDGLKIPKSTHELLQSSDVKYID